MRFLSIVLLLLAAFSLQAQQTAAERDPLSVDETTLTFDQPPAGAESGDIPVPQDVGVWDVLRMLLVLGLVVAFIWGFVWLMRRLIKRPEEKLDGVKLLATFSLSTTRVIYFLETGKRVLMLSGAENGVQLLSEIDDQELIDSLRLNASRVAARKDPFMEMIARFLKKPDTPEKDPTNVKESGDFLRLQRERLRNLEKGE